MPLQSITATAAADIRRSKPALPARAAAKKLLCLLSRPRDALCFAASASNSGGRRRRPPKNSPELRGPGANVAVSNTRPARLADLGLLLLYDQKLVSCSVFAPR